MRRIDTASSAVTAPTIPSQQSKKFWQDTVPTGGTIVPAWWLHQLDLEIENLIIAGGLTPSNTVHTQIRDAVNALISAAVSGVANLGKNTILGGDFATNPWQRGTSFVGVASGDYTADRWFYNEVGITVSDVTRVTGESVGRNALRLQITTAMPSPGASDNVNMFQRIEGFNIVPLLAGAVFSMRVRSNITGILAIAFVNDGNDRSFVAEVDITAANTFQDVLIVIPAFDTGGTWDYTNGNGLDVVISMAAGTSLETTAGSWQTGNFISTSNAINRAATIGNYIEFDQVQMEKGASKTDFEARPVGQELHFCHRYFELTGVGHTGVINTATSIQISFDYFAVKRAVPTITLNLTTGIEIDDGLGNFVSGASSPTIPNFDEKGCNVSMDGFTGLTVGRVATMQSSDVIAIDAEL